MDIRERLSKLREIMAAKNIDAYMIPSADFHQSEYVGEYFKSREFISGFNGSAGTVIVTKDFAGLWTDGRYFIQAEKQLEGTGIELMKMGVEGFPTTTEFLVANLPEGSVLGFDGRVISANEGNELTAVLAEKNIKIEYQYDLIDEIWAERPALSDAKAFALDVKFTGESIASKLTRIREKMAEKGASHHVITTLDDIAWIFNMRGGDVAHSPVVLAYTVITADKVCLFLDETKLPEDLKAIFAAEKIEILPYNDVYEFVKGIPAGEKVLVDGTKLNYAIFNNIVAEKIVDYNPSLFFKACKNETELACTRNAHIKDGVAITKFMYWLKNNVAKGGITELTAQAKIEEFRAQQKDFFDTSFGSISAYKEHAAMMHYSSTPETDVELKPEHLYLLDSGGQYLDGTTDITRTFVLGELSDELKLHFTSVVRGMINLSLAKFLYGCHGYNLDILCRGVMWKMGIDYQCGTGHGIGHVLNVHEAPNGFRWRLVPERFDSAVLEEGMITTNEPGIYIEGSHGIRIENEIVCKKAEKNLYGQFMNFEVITFAPIDLDGIDPELMTKEEKDYLNWYHGQVFEKIGPHLTEEERTWLKEYTRAI